MPEMTSSAATLRALAETASEEEAQAAIEMLRAVRQAATRGSNLGPVGDFMGIRMLPKEPGYARCELDVAKKLFNPYGSLHGAVVFAMIDYSMGAAVSGTLNPGELSATLEIKVNYISAVTHGTLIAESRVVNRGSRVSVVESRVTGDLDRLVAIATSTFYILPPH